MSDALRLYSISDRYINYLRSDPRLTGTYDNKVAERVHTRKYLGVVVERGGFNFFVPLSSKRSSDYSEDKDGTLKIRKSILPIIRMVSTSTRSKKPELLGTLRISNMIPVPDSELIPYEISEEPDAAYRALVTKEYTFIREKSPMIRSYANALYNQKINEDVLFAGKAKPNYLNSILDFSYAEAKCREFCAKVQTQNVEAPKPNPATKPPMTDRMAAAAEEAGRRNGEHQKNTRNEEPPRSE